MAIVKMKRLCVIVPADSRRTALRALSKLGCVELEKCDAQQLAGFGGQLHISEENTSAAAVKSELDGAIKLLRSLPGKKKASLIARRPIVTESQLFNQQQLEKARRIAGEINSLGADIAENCALQAKLAAQIAALSPWRPLDVPLNFAKTDKTVFYIGTLPAAADIQAVFESVENEAPESLCETVSDDNEQHYVTVTVHEAEADAALTLLKSAGFVAAAFKDVDTTADKKIKALEKKIVSLEEARAKYEQKLSGYQKYLPSLCLAFDAFSQEQKRDEQLSHSGRTESTVYLTGWMPAAVEQTVGKTLDSLGCAWSSEEPAEDDEPPVLMQNRSLIDPVVSVTEMYGIPEYHSLIDPNPTMYPFYVAFFGFIMADAGYGIVMFLGCWLALKLMQPQGGLKRMLRLFMHCGAATIVAGALFGGWFADSIQTFSATFLGRTLSIPPIWFDPLKDPMKMLYFSLALGAVHLCTGMALGAYRMIKQGDIKGAVFDVGSWYIVFIGAGIMALGSNIGIYIMGAGALMLLLTGGRDKKNIFGKIIGGLGKIYGVTGYLSDLLSYSRIMALGLSGAVVGQVMNKIGTMAGGGPAGLILFIVMFVAGHTFNIAISLLGAYVHTSRLQYIEFFGKFFEGGGKLFAPLSNNTKYVNIIREE